MNVNYRYNDNEMSIQTIKYDNGHHTDSKNALSKLYDSTTNPIACQYYGAGTHCNQESVIRKHKIWGGRGDTAKEDACMVAKAVYVNGEPLAILNIGKAGASVVDHSKDKGASSNVYELGLIVSDKVFAEETYDSKLSYSIVDAVRRVFCECTVDKGYSKFIATFDTANEYGIHVAEALNAMVVDGYNYIRLLGENSLAPDRFMFYVNEYDSGRNIYECSGAGTINDGVCSSTPAPKVMYMWSVENDHLLPNNMCNFNAYESWGPAEYIL